ncbi:KH domain-containing protein At1g09660/At1g09670-like isoform X2 [Durio zibethinus]|uniref:KH domain-containing protein At1g09660/At1g09670-like isoform X2 n=1 Tax=Durio zibethinus TaxID=66656 RepID=A0A6P6AD40_DURZI|nr:KH domain-containing protein At1g09660/At1g09670-like isoform X2 [Durio zibethinus]
MMGERIPPGTYFQYPPSGVPASPDRPSVLHTDSERYLAELLAEKQKLGPFTQVLPLCTRLLNQEIRRVSGLNPSFVDHERFEHDSPFRKMGNCKELLQFKLHQWVGLVCQESLLHQL